LGIGMSAGIMPRSGENPVLATLGGDPRGLWANPAGGARGVRAGRPGALR
jgi:hypothetical protein